MGQNQIVPIYIYIIKMVESQNISDKWQKFNFVVIPHIRMISFYVSIFLCVLSVGFNLLYLKCAYPEKLRFCH